MHIHDRPVVPANPVGVGKQDPPPPVFGYTATENFTDIPFPDFSYWGHEHGRIGGAPLAMASLHLYRNGQERVFGLVDQSHNIAAGCTPLCTQ